MERLDQSSTKNLESEESVLSSESSAYFRWMREKQCHSPLQNYSPFAHKLKMGGGRDDAESSEASSDGKVKQFRISSPFKRRHDQKNSLSNGQFSNNNNNNNNNNPNQSPHHYYYPSKRPVDLNSSGNDNKKYQPVTSNDDDRPRRRRSLNVDVTKASFKNKFNNLSTTAKGKFADFTGKLAKLKEDDTPKRKNSTCQNRKRSNDNFSFALENESFCEDDSTRIELSTGSNLTIYGLPRPVQDL
ncbi:hypothetical protein RFI_22565 [Reticulomyxa filosa]|uniref:Uncharacterized protein n=1 Tax=Reticulomyxa filosa TaxID=46433 RepID=X6MMZ3_RETFI|nr:hypothetical protein RFI_22565 [Reticulomyxa filosa]|eukprot:ETO14802.1 hypothetical protein RFI_22565 [Reticulomyxa filosa]